MSLILILLLELVLLEALLLAVVLEVVVEVLILEALLAEVVRVLVQQVYLLELVLVKQILQNIVTLQSKELLSQFGMVVLVGVTVPHAATGWMKRALIPMKSKELLMLLIQMETGETVMEFLI
jgi:hypothetical protein